MMAETSPDSKSPNSVHLRNIQTISIFLALFTLGLVTAILGVALLDLSELFGTDIEVTSQILITRAIGFLIGSLLSSSVIYRFVNGKICIILALIIGGLSNALIPAAGSVIAAHVCLFIAGACVGILEVGGNVWLVHMWKDKVAPMFQTYHLSFGIGALLAPVITEPFLSQRNTHHLNTSTPEVIAESRIGIPFALFGGAYAMVGVLVCVLFCANSSNFKQDDSNDVASSQIGEKSQERRSFEWLVVGHLVTYIFVQNAIETTVNQMLGVYVVSNENLNFDKSSASFLLAVFWFLYTAGRVVALILSFRVRPFLILMAMQTTCLTGVVLLLALGIEHGPSVWVAAAVIGFGLSPLYASVMSWAVRYVRLQYMHMTMVLMASCMGQMMPPLTVAPRINRNPPVFVYVVAGWMLAHTFNLVLMHRCTKNKEILQPKETVVTEAGAVNLDNLPS